MKFVIGYLCAGVLATVACADGPGVLAGPSAATADSSLAASPRSGDLFVTKECSQNAGLPGQFCTITSSNVKAIEVGSRVIYVQGRGPAGLDSDVILELPGPGNNRAFGHCTLIAPVRQCTFSGGTGKFTHFQATAAVSLPLGGPGGPNFSWTGTYSFNPRSGALRVEKECSAFEIGGDFCTITSSNVNAIEVGSKIVYLQPDLVGTPAGSDVVLDLPGNGNNKAHGNCSLAAGVCTFSGGTGKFAGFNASVKVSYLGGVNWGWEGTYRFNAPE